jgi:predicted Rossmann-fold nucleotide-binding protein
MPSDKDRQDVKGAERTETKRKENEPKEAKSGIEEKTTEPSKAVSDKPRTVSQKVLVAGSSRIREDNYEQIKTLAKMIGAKIMQVDNWMLLNGGASEKSSDGSLISVDELVCIGAMDGLRNYGDHKLEKEKILTLQPEKGDKPLHDIGNVEVDKGADPFLRRRHLAERADVIVTIEGGNIGTKQIVDYALKELKKLEEVWSGTILSQL